MKAHEAGEPECPNPKDRPRVEQRRNPSGSETPVGRALPAPQEEQLAIEDQEVASNEEMGPESPAEMDVLPPPTSG